MPAAQTRGAATMIGSSGWWVRSARLRPTREASPWWENSLSTPVSVIGLSGRPVTIDHSMLSPVSTRSAASRISQCAARPRCTSGTRTQPRRLSRRYALGEHASPNPRCLKV